MIRTKRVYEPFSEADGARYIVERLWPRGVAKARLVLDAWLKDVAPTTELRRWFNHDPARWMEFKHRYEAELRAHPDAWAHLLAEARRGSVTLLYSAHDREHNSAIALGDFLSSRLKSDDAGAVAQRKVRAHSAHSRA